MSVIERVQVAPGEGTVAREGATVLVAGVGVPTEVGVVADALGWAAQGLHGAALVRRLGGALAPLEPLEVPALAVLTLTPSGAAVLLSGDTEASIDAEGSTATLSGLDAVTYVDRVVSHPDSVRLALPRAAEVDASLTLGNARACPGSGCRVELSRLAVGQPSEAATTGVWTDPDPTVSTAVIPRVSPDIARLSETRPGSYVNLRTTRHPSDVEVLGVRCPHGHFTRPGAVRCLHCGAPLDPGAEPLRGIRPPLGLLTTDHGEQRVIERNLVIGRDPGSADDVSDGIADPLPLNDPQLATSRVHCRLLLDGWDVRVEDAHSANGTFISDTEGEWERLVPGEPRTIESGTHIAVGSRILHFSTPYAWS